MPGVLLFGGSFDPIHHGHLIVARAAAERLQLPRVILIPSAIPPHKQDRSLTSGAHRVALCRAAVAGDDLFDVSDWEMQQAGPSYTLSTVEHFTATTPAGTPLYWLIGMDSLVELHTWYRVDALAEACTLVTAGRPGFVPRLEALRERISAAALQRIQEHILETPLIEISATEIRTRAARRRPLRYLVPDAVAEYIATHHLYRS